MKRICLLFSFFLLVKVGHLNQSLSGAFTDMFLGSGIARCGNG